MNIILLSGGSGKRLWPLSNDARSKQFLKMLDNDGTMESMLQRVWRQLKTLKMDTSTVIATSKAQVDIIQNQLGNHIPLVIEPERRDTFPAIALASTYLYSKQNVNLDEVIGIVPVDPYVELSYFEKVNELERVIKESTAEIALIGVKPTYPSEMYGYIVPVNNENEALMKVSHFKEKPSEEDAKKLMNNHALWNCGIFAFKLNYILSLLEDKGFPTEYEELLKRYHELEKTSFDYAVVEKAKEIVAIPYEGTWKDLGTWDTLTQEMSENVIGKGVISQESKNVHLINELDIPITVMGIDNAVVAASPDGILVADKASSGKIKEIIKNYDDRPMYEERRWGWYKVLDYTKYDDKKEVLTKRICIKEGRNLSYQKHYLRSEVWTVLKGEGEFALNDEIRKVKAGDVLIIPVESKHGIKAITDLEFIEVQSGSHLIEEDIVRIFMTWEEVQSACNYVK